LWVTKQLRDLPEIISIGEIAELKVVRESGGALRIGAGATLTDAYGALARHYPELAEMWERFASPPIRNAGTMGGNVANGSPIGDSMPGSSPGASVILRNRERSRTLPMEDLYVGYMQKAMAADEFWRRSRSRCRTRAQVSHVQAVEALRLRHFRRLCRVCHRARRATGSRAAGSPMAASRPRRSARARRSARSSERLDRGDGASGDGRARLRLHSVDRHAGERRLPRRIAQNLLYRFYLETRPDRPLSAAEVSVFAVA
jgi:xanthine dehydrogenase small subunit